MMSERTLIMSAQCDRRLGAVPAHRGSASLSKFSTQLVDKRASLLGVHVAVVTDEFGKFILLRVEECNWPMQRMGDRLSTADV
jgi:hypothetical protein